MNRNACFQIDGRTIPFNPGDTIMDAAIAASIYIPHLCHNPQFKPHGSCRVCVVRSNGRCFSSCTQPAAAGLEIENNTPEVNDYRRTLIQMLFVEGNHVCPACEKSGACQLQAVAYYVSMLSPRFTQLFPHRQVDASHPDIIIDFNRCILCELCVRASRDVDGKGVFSISGRGIGAHLVIDSASGRLGESRLTPDDRAATICPVGAILPKGDAYATPIGQRRYDRQSIDIVGDATASGRPEEQDG